jgi:NAD(P)-dependent dehydrogenase (short-subunit alcohol dehydrogenase family)
MTGRLAGKAALVVGGGSRFGQAVAAALGREGAAVAVGCGDEASGCAAVALVEAAGGRARHVLLDPLDAASCAAAVAATLETFGRLDVLVTRVVGPPRQPRPLHEIGVEEWDETIGHVVDAAALPVWHAQRAMLARGGGSIVVVSSSAALVGRPGMAALSAAAGALVNFTRSTGVEGWRQGVPVRVNCLCLGVPPAPPDEVAPLVVFLASDESQHVNGQVIPIDDGATAWRD